MPSPTADIKYHAEAYEFVRETVNFAIKRAGETRHVSALELLESCRIYAIEQYGFLADSVLKNWGISNGDDVGNIVFELIEKGKLSASPGDKREDFSIPFDLFEKNLLRIKHKIPENQPLITD